MVENLKQSALKAARARLVQLIAAGLPIEDAVRVVGVPAAIAKHWADTKRFEREVYIAMIAYNSVLEASLNTGRRARGCLPLPLVLQADFEDYEQADDPA